MRGDLSETAATDVCRALAATAASGVLDIEGPDGRGAIVFQGGRVVAATSPTPRARLGDRLVNAGLLDEDALDDVLRSQARAGTHRRLGGLLVGRGLVSQDAVRLVAQEQVIDAVFDVVRWRYGGYRFDEGDLSDDTEVPLDIPLDQLLVEVSRREQEWVEVERVIPDLDAVPSFVSGTGSATASLEPDEFTVLASIDGARSVRELADDLGYGQFEAARIVYGLTMLGIVEVSLPEDEVGRALEEALSALAESTLPDEPDLPPMVVPEPVPDEPSLEPGPPLPEPGTLPEPEPFPEPEPVPEPQPFPEPEPFDPEPVPEPEPFDPEPFDPEPVPVPPPGGPDPYEPVPIEPDPETFETDDDGAPEDGPALLTETDDDRPAEDEPALLTEPEVDVDPADDAEPEPWDAPPVEDVVATDAGEPAAEDADGGAPALDGSGADEATEPRAVLEVDLPGPADDVEDDGPTSLVDVARLLADLEVGRPDDAAADDEVDDAAEADASDAAAADADAAGGHGSSEEPAEPEQAPGPAAPRGAEVSELLRELSRLALEDGTAAEPEPRREPPTPPSEPRRPEPPPPREEPPRRRRLFGRG